MRCLSEALSALRANQTPSWTRLALPPSGPKTLTKSPCGCLKPSCVPVWELPRRRSLHEPLALYNEPAAVHWARRISSPWKVVPKSPISISASPLGCPPHDPSHCISDPSRVDALSTNHRIQVTALRTEDGTYLWQPIFRSPDQHAGDEYPRPLLLTSVFARAYISSKSRHV